MGLTLIKQVRHTDNRGYFADTYNKREFADMMVYSEFGQDNHSMPRAIGTLWGLHFHAPPAAQGKAYARRRSRI